MRRPLTLFVALGAVACADPLSLPSEPTGFERPSILAATPAAAFAGDLVRLELSSPPAASDQPLVGFPSGELVPLDRADGLFAVRVPDDAGSGPLSLVTQAGRAVSSIQLKYRGLGRLRRREEVRRYQTSITLAAATVLDDGTELALVDLPGGFLIRSPGIAERWLPIGNVLLPSGLIASDAGGPFLVFGRALEGGPCDDGSGDYLPVVASYWPPDADLTHEAGLGRATCLPAVRPEFGGATVDVVMGAAPAGPRRLVVGVIAVDHEPVSRGWLVDWDAGTFEAIPSATDRPLVDLLAGPGSHFTLLETEQVRVVAPDRLADPPVEHALALRETEKATVGLWVNDDLLAYGTTRGAIRLAQPVGAFTVIADDIPAPAVAIGQDPRVSLLGLSDDKRVLLAVHQQRGLLRSFDLAHGAAPITGLSIGSPFALSTARDGTFRVTADNSIVAVSQDSGAIIEVAWTSIRLGSPSFALSRCEPGELRVVVAGATVGEFQERDPRTLLPVICESAPTPADALGRLVEIAANASGSDRFAAHEERGLVRIRAGAAAYDVFPGFSIDLPQDPLERARVRRLHLSADGHTLLAHDLSPDRLSVFDTATFETGPALTIATPVGLLRALSDNETIVLLERTQVHRLDAAAARRGQELRREPVITLPRRARVADAVQGQLFVVTDEQPAAYLLVDLATGTVTQVGADPLGFPYVSDAVLSPSGREAYVLFRDYDQSSWLDVVALDPAVVGSSARLVFSREQGEVLTQLAISPDGERLLATDLATNRLFVVE